MIPNPIAHLPGYLPPGRSKRPKCLRCHRELRHVLFGSEGHQVFFRHDATHIRYGAHGNGIFCTVTCGFLWALKELRDPAESR